jgi:hypothetical protein
MDGRFKPQFRDKRERKADLSYLRSGDRNFAIGVLTNKTYNIFTSHYCLSDSIIPWYGIDSVTGVSLFPSEYATMEVVDCMEEDLKVMGMKMFTNYNIFFYRTTDLNNHFHETACSGQKLDLDIDLNKTDEDFIVLFVIAKKEQDLPSNLSINNNDPIHSSESLRFSDFENLDDNFNIYPNPTNSNIYISKPTSVESFTCIIKTFDGKQIIDKVYDKDAEIELQNFENGIYYITIYIDGQVFETKKIIKL